MRGTLHIGENGNWVVVAVYSLPREFPPLRWVKSYSSRDDAFLDSERLGLISEETATDLRAFPVDREIPVLNAYVRDPKETLRGFAFCPLTFAH